MFEQSINFCCARCYTEQKIYLKNSTIYAINQKSNAYVFVKCNICGAKQYVAKNLSLQDVDKTILKKDVKEVKRKGVVL